jgi:hypothetical protein
MTRYCLAQSLQNVHQAIMRSSAAGSPHSSASPLNILEGATIKAVGRSKVLKVNTVEMQRIKEQIAAHDPVYSSMERCISSPCYIADTRCTIQL